MIEILNKEKSLHPHKEGKFTPQEIELLRDVDGAKETIKALPIPRKKLREILLKTEGKEETDRDTDIELVLEYCVEPKFTKEELEFVKPKVLSNIANTIFQLSGLDMKKREEQIKKQEELENG